jgi:hypothetical protein
LVAVSQSLRCTLWSHLQVPLQRQLAPLLLRLVRRLRLLALLLLQRLLRLLLPVRQLRCPKPCRAVQLLQGRPLRLQKPESCQSK